MTEEKRKVLKTMRFKSKNNVPLKLVRYIALDGYEKGRELWEVNRTDKKSDDWESYVDRVSSFQVKDGKFYKSGYDFISFDEYVKIWKNRYLLKGMGEGCLTKDYRIDLYKGKDTSKQEFAEIVKNTKFLLDKGKRVEYNDDHGVGSFEKKGAQYEATHHRYGTTKKETLTIEGVEKFLRDFFDLGYSYEKKNTWENAKV